MLLEVRDLQFRRGKRLILEGIHLSIPPGAGIWITGPNGSGKTMLTRALAGLLPSCEPYIQRSVALNVGLFLNRPSLYPELTVQENLGLYQRLWRADATEAKRFLRLVDLDPDSRVPVRKLSLGMQQKAGLAVSLVTEPNLLLWDEPFNAIDHTSLQAIGQYLQALQQERQVALVMTSHVASVPILAGMQALALREGRPVAPEGSA